MTLFAKGIISPMSYLRYIYVSLNFLCEYTCRLFNLIVSIIYISQLFMKDICVCDCVHVYKNISICIFLQRPTSCCGPKSYNKCSNLIIIRELYTCHDLNEELAKWHGGTDCRGPTEHPLMIKHYSPSGKKMTTQFYFFLNVIMLWFNVTNITHFFVGERTNITHTSLVPIISDENFASLGLPHLLDSLFFILFFLLWIW